MALRARRASGATIVGVLAVCAALLVATEPAGASGPAGHNAQTTSNGLPPIRHVFVIMLENEDYSATFGRPKADPYLAKTLVEQGILLKNYYGVGHYSNDNYVGFISGQPPNADNQLDCLQYVDFPPGDGRDAHGIQQGAGCVYPAEVRTLVGELTAAGDTWKGYMEDMGNDPSRESVTCAHPTIGSDDPAVFAVPGDGYATRHDPFVYFHSIINDTPHCERHVVPLGSPTGSMPAGTPSGITGLATDLQSIGTTPNFSFITPNLCDDGHDYPCVNQPSGPSRLADVDAFLSTWVPLIEASPAFRADGLLEITWDEAENPKLDTRACCGETPGPAASNGDNGLSGPGGGKVGAVLISPYIKAGKVVDTKFNHYSSLASIEDLFRLPRLGEAQTVTSTFDTKIFSSTKVSNPSP